MKTEREQTIQVLEHIRDLLESSDGMPGTPSPRGVSKAWALAYAECERLSKLELDAMRTVFDDEETVHLDADFPDLARAFASGLQVSDSVLLTGGV